MRRRVTTHNGRCGKDGVYDPRHNDRNFISESDHINKEKSGENQYWMCYKNCENFEECEKTFYEKYFQKGLEKINEKHIRARNYKRVKTMDEYRQSPRTCPEESLIYAGDRHQPIDRKLFQTIVIKQINWEMKTFPNVKILDLGFHVDEEVNGVPSADHFHIRRAWVAHDADGNLIVNQTKALEEMGVERPDPSRPKDRYNNPKMTYTKAIRDHFIELCRYYGLEIEDVPREKSKSGLSLDMYKSQKMTEEAKWEADQMKEEAKQEAEAMRLEAERYKEFLLFDVQERERAVSRREDAVTEKEKAQQKQTESFQGWEDRLEAQRKSLEKSERALKADREHFNTKVYREAVRLANEWKEEEEEKRQVSRSERADRVDQLFGF